MQLPFGPGSDFNKYTIMALKRKRNKEGRIMMACSLFLPLIAYILLLVSLGVTENFLTQNFLGLKFNQFIFNPLIFTAVPFSLIGTVFFIRGMRIYYPDKKFLGHFQAWNSKIRLHNSQVMKNNWPADKIVAQEQPGTHHLRDHMMTPVLVLPGMVVTVQKCKNPEFATPNMLESPPNMRKSDINGLDVDV